MLILRLWNYIVGYLVIRVDGLSLEKFINLTISNGIFLWGIKRSGYTTMAACISISGFKKLKGIARKVRCRVRIVDKRGLPFLLVRLRHRKMLLMGLTAFLIILYGLSSFIWTVDVEGNVKVPENKLLNALAKYGIRPGAFKKGLDISAIENRLVIDIPDIWWVSIQLKGTRAIVKVVEAAQPPPMVDKDTPCNIVASKDGIIHKMVVLEGQPMVKEGDTVKKGQLLVSGVVEDPETLATRFVHAMAQVTARTWYEGQAVCSLDEGLTRRTGRKVVHKFIDMGRWVVEYQKEGIPFEHYEVEEKKVPFFGEGRFFPVTMIVREYYEVEKLPASASLQDLKEIAQKKAMEDVNKKIPSNAKVVDKQVKYDMIEGKEIKATVYVEVLEDIALEQKITVE